MPTTAADLRHDTDGTVLGAYHLVHRDSSFTGVLGGVEWEGGRTKQPISGLALQRLVAGCGSAFDLEAYDAEYNPKRDRAADDRAAPVQGVQDDRRYQRAAVNTPANDPTQDSTIDSGSGRTEDLVPRERGPQEAIRQIPKERAYGEGAPEADPQDGPWTRLREDDRPDAHPHTLDNRIREEEYRQERDRIAGMHTMGADELRRLARGAGVDTKRLDEAEGEDRDKAMAEVREEVAKHFDREGEELAVPEDSKPERDEAGKSEGADERPKDPHYGD